MKPETKYKGSIKLSAIGDALGWMTEFEKTSQSVKNRYGTEKIENFQSWTKNVGGRFYGFVDNLKEGSYSDDTQLLLAVARSIRVDGTVDNQYFAKIELANWLAYARGGGRTVKTAAEKIQRRSANWNSNFYNYKVNGENFDYKQSGANGAAMRVLPIALANLGNVHKIKREIFFNSIITHGHPRAILGAMLYGFAVNQIMIYRPEDFSWESYLTQIGTDFHNKFSLDFINSKEIQDWFILWDKASEISFADLYSEILKETQAQLRYVFQSIKQNTSVVETLKNLGCFAPSTKGSGTATVLAGIFLATKFHNKPIEAIVEAVNALGSDTDSIAAFTGSLVGALHGQSIIPEKWKSVQDIDYLEKTAERLLQISEDRFEDGENFLSKGYRNINELKVDDFTEGENIDFVPLGSGKIVSIDRQPTLTKGKYNLLLNIDFEIGQSVLISKIFSDKNQDISSNKPKNGLLDETLSLASEKLSADAYDKVENFLKKEKRISNELLQVLRIILLDAR